VVGKDAIAVDAEILNDKGIKELKDKVRLLLK
jgi:hypothetical protein